ncbi:DNA integrity scanning protein DisA nucleotide-binding domain protein [Paenibacillus sp. FSL R5-0475]|uniref:DNA integrity scanning protein DisA nucleotide-binding domain protein n=1 Tax=Paenibacillus sp. FSL R5-0475 TaxID=2921643 RepID=UPI0030FCEA1C
MDLEKRILDKRKLHDRIFDYKEELDKINEQKYQRNKQKILDEFSKILPRKILECCVKEVYKVDIYFKKNVSHHVCVLPEDSEKTEIIDAVEIFINNEFQRIESLESKTMHFSFTIEKNLHRKNDEFVYWCSDATEYGRYMFDPRSDYSFELVLIKFDRIMFLKYLNWTRDVHPFIKHLKIGWELGYNNHNYDEIFKRAVVNSEKFLMDNYTHFDILSALKYENQINNGSIIYINSKQNKVSDDEHKVRILVELEHNIEIKEHKHIRKLLQMTNDSISLLINDNYEAYAIGSVNKESNYFKVRFKEYLHWQLDKNGQRFLGFLNLRPYLPTEISYRDELYSKLDIMFGNDISDVDKARLDDLVGRAAAQRHGTMIVISEKAIEETERLSYSGTLVKAAFLENEVIELVSNIDGAIMVDQYGQCFGLGIILDGAARSIGEPSRGARFNSALRYISKQKEEGIKCLIVVISEDQYIDILSTSDKVV